MRAYMAINVNNTNVENMTKEMEFVEDSVLEVGVEYKLYKRIIDMARLTSYKLNQCRVFLVDVLAKDIMAEEDDELYYANRIRVVKELSKEDVDKYFLDNLNKFVNNKDWRVRAVMIQQGYGLDKLVNDKNIYIKLLMIEQGYGLDIYINDKDHTIRAAVANQGYGLDILMYDKDYNVRVAVASQGYGLDALIYDSNYSVRSIAKAMYNNNKIY